MCFDWVLFGCWVLIISCSVLVDSVFIKRARENPWIYMVSVINYYLDLFDIHRRIFYASRK